MVFKTFLIAFFAWIAWLPTLIALLVAVTVWAIKTTTMLGLWAARVIAAAVLWTARTALVVLALVVGGVAKLAGWLR